MARLLRALGARWVRAGRCGGRYEAVVKNLVLVFNPQSAGRRETVAVGSRTMSISLG